MFRSIFSIFNKNNKSINNITKNTLINLQEFKLQQSIITISVRNGRYSAPTKKRRKTFPFHWWPRQDKDILLKNYLTEDNEKFLNDFIQDRLKNQQQQESPLKLQQKQQQQDDDRKYKPGSIRCGVIAKKIGQQPMWTKTGQRILTTALQILDNHVVSYLSNEDFKKTRRPFYNFHKFKNLDVLIVGAETADYRQFPSQYLGLFQKANLLPKKKLTRFFITPNARLEPGTPLNVNHFRVGDYVDVWGKTRDHGFQGVIKRWKFKGQLKHKGVTKAHRRPGTIARGRKLMGPLKGHKMAGHMGSERRVQKGLKIWRINTKYNVLWVHGPAIPGENNSWCYIYDTTLPLKKYKEDNPPPFPTYLETDDTVATSATGDDNDAKVETLPENIYDKDLHAFDQPSLVFEETEEERKAAAAALKMTKKAKIAKIR